MDYFFTDIYKSLSEGKTDVGEAIHEAGEELRRQAEQKNKQDQFFSGFNNEDWKKREIVIRKKYEEQITELKQENDELVERMEEINRKWQTEVGLLKERLKEKDNRIRQLLEQSDNNYQFSSRDRPEEESTELFKKTPPQHRKPNLSTMSETVIEVKGSIDPSILKSFLRTLWKRGLWIKKSEVRSIRRRQRQQCVSSY